MATTYLTRSDVTRLTELESTLRTLLDEARHEGNKYEDMPECSTCGSRHYGRPRGEQCALPDGFAETAVPLEADDSGELDEAALRAEDEADIAERYADLSELERSIILAIQPHIMLMEDTERDLAAAVAAVVTSEAESKAEVKARAAENRPAIKARGAINDISQQLDQAFALASGIHAWLVQYGDKDEASYYLGGTGAHGVCIDGPLRMLEMIESVVGDMTALNRLSEDLES